LVEYSIERLLPRIDEERERHRKRLGILAEITEYLEQGEGILEKSEEILGEDDPVYEKLEAAIRRWRNTRKHIICLVNRGKIIDE
jgi:hypothetical protein